MLAFLILTILHNDTVFFLSYHSDRGPGDLVLLFQRLLSVRISLIVAALFNAF